VSLSGISELRRSRRRTLGILLTCTM